MLASLLLETKKDQSSASTQLQLAAKGNPSLLERYFIHVGNQTAKLSRKEGKAGMDLLGYVEFQRSYRCGMAGDMNVHH